MSEQEESNYSIKDLETDFKPTWCPGCGNFSQWRAIRQSIVKLNIPPEKVAIVSGIGCSSHIPNFVDFYSLQAVHGRAIPVATGIRLANPKLTVMVYGGDGDIYGIGGNHFLHACRRNVDIITMVSNNYVYGLTTGQASPTTLVGTKTKTTPRGSIENPLNPVSVAIAAGATFVARGFSGDLKQLTEILTKAIKHKGFAFIDILSPCVTFNQQQTYFYFRDRVFKIEETEHDVEDMHAAMDLANLRKITHGKIPIGIFYEQKNKTTYEERDFTLNQGVVPAKTPLELDEDLINAITEEFY